MSRYYTRKEILEKLNISTGTFYNWIKKDKIKHVTLPSGQKRYLLETEDQEEKKKIDTVLYIQESQPENKQMILEDRPISYSPSIPTIPLSRILDQDLTIKEKDCYLWWTESCKEMSRKLWLPTETDSVDLDLNLSNTSVKPLIPESWFSTTRIVPKNQSWSKISLPLLLSFPVGSMDLENIETKLVVNYKKRKKGRKTKKLQGLHRMVTFRLYPTKQQAEILRQWFGTVRKCYNLTIDRFLKQGRNMLLSPTIRKQILNIIPFDHSKVNLEAKKQGIEDAFKAIGSNSKSDFKFRSRKNSSESIYVRSGCISNIKKTIFPTTFKNMKIRPEGMFKPAGIFDSGRLIRQGKRFFLKLPIDRPANPSLKDDTDIVALDPGCKNFISYYSPKEAGILGQNVQTYLLNRCYKADKLVSKISKAKTARKRYKLKQALSRLRYRIKNQVTDLHWKSASFLCKNYKYIFLPEFKTQQMTSSANRKISSKTARNMMTLSHYTFFLRLKSKAEELGCCVFRVKEPYTSKYCSSCGNVKWNLTLSDRVYSCSKCGIQADRDLNAAKNIYLRSLGLLGNKQ